LLPAKMFQRELLQGRLERPFGIAIDAGSYWLTCLKSKRQTDAMQAFRDWLISRAIADDPGEARSSADTQPATGWAHSAGIKRSVREKTSRKNIKQGRRGKIATRPGANQRAS
jgi:hypothetical protein